MERIIFRILQDGTVEETVEGVVGSGCLEITEKIESDLGVVQWRKEKPEYYQQKQIEDVTLHQNQNQDY
tara:strand:- start:322 stop:528 length:207 start_codon:yes stop_codon:yes gene_type:complete